MHVRAIGTFEYKGDAGIYFEAIDQSGPRRFGSVSYAYLPGDEHNLGMIIGKEFIVPDDTELYERIEESI